jgi:predicted MPP superfamily phosphohydrolase
MTRRRWTWIRRAVRTVTLSCLAALLYAAAVEPFWIETTRHTVTLPVGAPLRIVLLSDLHVQARGRRERRVLEIVREQRPDVILVAGDDVATRGGTPLSPDEATAVRGVLSDLRAPLGVFAVLGNWEHWRWLAHGSALEGLGVRWLVDDAAEIRPGLWLVGLDDACASRPDVAAAFRRVPPSALALTLMHSPAPFAQVAARSPLALAGHTHGGQIRLPFLPPLWRPPGSGDYVAGWYRRGASRLYVTRGIGTSILPLRFLCRPEVAVIDVVPQ